MKADELWVLQGREPVLWTVPVFVTWLNEEWGHLYYAVQLSVKHQIIIEDQMLKAVATLQRNHMWLIRRSHLKQIAELTSGGDPETYFSWERPRLSQKPCFQPEKRVERDAFLDGFFQSGCGGPKASREDVDFWWRQFCDYMLHYLLNKEKPVDLYFIRLHCSPYRENWKTGILGRFPWLGSLLCHTEGIDRMHHAIKSGLMEELTCLDMLATHRRDGLCYRQIEVEHRPSWWKKMLKVEKVRLARVGSVQYAKDFMASIRRRFETTLRLYVGWLALIKHPSATDVECGHQGEFRFVPNISKRMGFRRYARYSAVLPLVVPNITEAYKPPSDPQPLYAQDVGLSALRLVRRGSKDVRRGWAQIYKPKDGNGGKAGLRLLPADQKPPPLELLGVETNGRTKGMAEQP